MAKILIVDDDPLIAMLIQAWLVEMEHEPVGPAHSLSEALALVAADLDGAIVDVKLGAESGGLVAEALVAKGAPFVYATGGFEEELADLPRGCGVLTKPFGFAAFEAAIRSMFAGG